MPKAYCNTINLCKARAEKNKEILGKGKTNFFLCVVCRGFFITKGMSVEQSNSEDDLNHRKSRKQLKSK